MSKLEVPLTDRELLVRIDAKLEAAMLELTRHVTDDRVLHHDLETRISKMEAFRTGVVMVVGFVTVVAGTAAAFATNLF